MSIMSKIQVLLKILSVTERVIEFVIGIADTDQTS